MGIFMKVLGIKSKKLINIDRFITFIHRKENGAFYFSGESHDFWEFVYVKEGNVGITADDKIYSLKKGDMIIHKPMEFHAIYSEDSKGFDAYIFSFSAFGDGLKNLERKRAVLTDDKVNLIENVISYGNKAFLSDKGNLISINDELNYNLYLNTLEIFLLSICNCKEFKEITDSDTLMFSKIIKYLGDNIYGKIKVDDVAKRLYISTSKLKKLFHKYTGMGVLAYFNKLKINKAKKLLQEGKSVGEVAKELSYSSSFYFSKLFKEETKLLASDFKKSQMLN